MEVMLMVRVIEGFGEGVRAGFTSSSEFGRLLFALAGFGSCVPLPLPLALALALGEREGDSVGDALGGGFSSASSCAVDRVLVGEMVSVVTEVDSIGIPSGPGGEVDGERASTGEAGDEPDFMITLMVFELADSKASGIVVLEVEMVKEGRVAGSEEEEGDKLEERPALIEEAESAEEPRDTTV